MLHAVEKEGNLLHGIEIPRNWKKASESISYTVQKIIYKLCYKGYQQYILTS